MRFAELTRGDRPEGTPEEVILILLTPDELTWLAARAGVIDHEAISSRPRPDELTAEGLLTLRVKLAAALRGSA